MDALLFKSSVNDHYYINEEIGRGGFSVVKRGVDRLSGTEVAIKIVSKADMLEEALTRELNIMKTVHSCPQVVSLLGVYEEADCFYIVLELVNGGNLLDTILKQERCNETDTARILRSILKAIAHCHEQGIVHRDMKLDNLLVSHDLSIIKLSDFGLATILGPNQTAKSTVGTRPYLPPEMILKHSYNTSVDMWSIGCIAYTLLAGYHPFSEASEIPLYIQIVTGNWEFHDETWANISDDAKDFISELLVIDPLNRMTAKQALMHPWIRMTHFTPKTSHVA
jgi:serine/threonine protein kinase